MMPCSHEGSSGKTVMIQAGTSLQKNVPKGLTKPDMARKTEIFIFCKLIFDSSDLGPEVALTRPDSIEQGSEGARVAGN